MKSICLLFLIVSLNAQAAITKVFNSASSRFIGYEAFIQNVNLAEFVVMGEFHNDEQIQLAEAQIITDTVASSNSQNNFSLMWEFLDFTDQNKINKEYEKFKNNQISAYEFLSSSTSNSNSKTYAPVVTAARDFGANIWGLNLPREIKQKAMEEGINSIDPKLVPKSHYVGGPEYKDRFAESMGGHVPPEKISKYFLAQCLTDSVMAYQANLRHSHLSFIIAGSFHTDFYDATVVRLKNLTEKKIVTIKIVNLSDLSEEDVQELKNGSSLYGAYADYIVFSR